MKCRWSVSTLFSSCDESFWANLVLALMHKLCQFMNRLHQPEEAMKFAGFFKANSGIFIRFSTLIHIAVQLIITPFVRDFRI